MLEALAWLLAGIPAALLLWFTLEVGAGLKPLGRRPPTGDRPPRTIILIPAHNEQAGIAATLDTLQPLPDWLQVLVVADNCTDSTAAVARRAGAEVAERHDTSRLGKGYALAHGRDHLAQRPTAERPEAVVVLDADCRTDQASVLVLAQQAVSRQAPVQARNLLTSDGNASALTQISNFAMLVKNLVRARGLQRIGGGIPLFGTGMAFPWPIFAGARLATDHLVEDMQLALDLAREGVKVTLVEQARVLSAAAPDQAARTQRGRWERGFLHTARSQAVPMLLSGVAGFSRHRTTLGMHLLVPPLALLLLLAFVCLAAATALGLFTGQWAPAALLLLTLAGALAAVALAWMREGRSTLPAGSLARAPLYILWKIPLYLGFFKRNRGGWTRTRRLDESD